MDRNQLYDRLKTFTGKEEPVYLLRFLANTLPINLPYMGH
jgi:hypothetical protein